MPTAAPVHPTTIEIVASAELTRRRPPLASCRPLDDADLALARKAISDLGLTEAARALDVPRNTLAGAAGGARLREGTRMVMGDRLRRRAAKGA